MTDPNPPSPYSRPQSSAASTVGQQPSQLHAHSPSPRPSVASRSSRGSLRRQAAIAAGSASASASASLLQQQQQQAHSQQAQQSPQPSPPSQPQPPPPDPHLDPGDPELQLPRLTQLFTTVLSTAQPSARSTTHHPTVHYIFADDDPDTLTSALAQHHHHRQSSDELDADTAGGAEHSSPTSGNTRAVLVDLVPAPETPAGFEVGAAASLSGDWAVVDARVGRMEGTLGGAAGRGQGGEDEGGGGMLTLQIEGVSVEPSRVGSPSASRIGTGSGKKNMGGSQAGGGKVAGREGEKDRGKGEGEREREPSEEYPALVEEFERRMEVLRRVVEAAERRRLAVDEYDGGGEGGDDVDGAEDGEEEETQRPEEETQRPMPAFGGGEEADRPPDDDDDGGLGADTGRDGADAAGVAELKKGDVAPRP